MDDERKQIEAASARETEQISRATVVSASGATSSTTSGIIAGDANGNAPPLQPQPGQLVPPAINPSSTATAAGAVGAAGAPAGTVMPVPAVAGIGTPAPPARAPVAGGTAAMTPGSARIYQAAPGATAPVAQPVVGAATIGSSSLSQQQPLAPGTPPLSASGNAPPPAASAIGPGVGVNNAGASTSTASTSTLPAPAPSAMITAKPTLPLPNATPVFGHAQQYQQSGPGGANVLSPMAQMARPAPVVVPGASSASAGSSSFLSAAVNTGGPGGSVMKPQYG